ncbi:hypothetical protein SDC9_97197 [bioreactor metagenome]|uniref:Uncharacterized protein n=1 Tax=bioreactor metagenome TaxID=1076179 RepID=A0A645ABQ2_9ZZZZ
MGGAGGGGEQPGGGDRLHIGDPQCRSRPVRHPVVGRRAAGRVAHQGQHPGRLTRRVDRVAVVHVVVMVGRPGVRQGAQHRLLDVGVEPLGEVVVHHRDRHRAERGEHGGHDHQDHRDQPRRQRQPAPATDARLPSARSLPRGGQGGGRGQRRVGVRRDGTGGSCHQTAGFST